MAFAGYEKKHSITERQIGNYLNENKVNFDKKDDLLKLCQFFD